MLQSRFGRNKHQNLVRQMFHIRQTSTVEEYVERFSELYDQLTAYETNPSAVHYVTRFMEGLTPSVRLLVGIQQPADLDSAYALALLSEELGDTTLLQNSSSSFTKRSAVPVVGRASTKFTEEKKLPEPARAPSLADDRSLVVIG